MKLLRITKVDFENEYEPVVFIPPSAQPVTGAHQVGDFVVMSDHGYIRERYRKPLDKINRVNLFDWGSHD